MAEKYTEAQKKVLEKYAVDLYKTFLLMDPDLKTSKCLCCRDRRELAAKIEKELQDESSMDSSP